MNFADIGALSGVIGGCAGVLSVAMVLRDRRQARRATVFRPAPIEASKLALLEPSLERLDPPSGGAE